MIGVDKFRDDEQGNAIEPNAAWVATASTKTQEAIDDGDTHTVTSHYKTDHVRSVLEKVFLDKCAYCETIGVAGFEWDVEHYRPKGRVNERQDHPGYYWLAYEYTNLYLSCTFCNQRRRDKPRWDDPVAAKAAGKLDQFPLVNETTRAMDPDGDLDAEALLLIDPCSDDPAEDPETLLRFTPKGTAVAIDGSEMAKKSIKVFALNRKRLRDARVAKVREVNELIDASVGQGFDRQLAIEVAIEVLSRRDKVYAAVVRTMDRNRTAFDLD